MVPIASGHKKCIAMTKYYFVSFRLLYRRKLFGIELAFLRVCVVGKIGKAHYFKGLSVQLVLLAVRKKQYPFSSHELGMQNVRQVNIKMHMGNGASSAGK